MEHILNNRHGSIKTGTKVWFLVENQSCWAGDNEGVLMHDGKDFYIQTKRSGKVTIDKGYDAYFNTIEPLP